MLGEIAMDKNKNNNPDPRSETEKPESPTIGSVDAKSEKDKDSKLPISDKDSFSHEEQGQRYLELREIAELKQILIAKEKSDKLSRANTFVALLAGIGSLFAVGYGGFFWLDERVEKLVTKQITPYQYLINGITLVQDEEYDKAIEQFRPALRKLKDLNKENKNLGALVDFYLMAMVNSGEPIEYSPDFQKLLPLLKNDLPRWGWRFHQIGWYYLRTGELDKAKENFIKAKRRFKVEDEFSASADTYWALVLVYVASGDIEKAVSHALYAEERRFRDFNLDTLIHDVSAYKNDPWYKRLARSYDDFYKHLEILVNRLKEIKSEQNNPNISLNTDP